VITFRFIGEIAMDLLPASGPRTAFGVCRSPCCLIIAMEQE
jgi:hypothetical protein